MDTFRSSETASLANRAYVDMSDDLSTEEEGISTQDEDEEVEGGEKETEEEEDPLTTFLQGRKPENMTLNERRDILKAILVAQPTAKSVCVNYYLLK